MFFASRATETRRRFPPRTSCEAKSLRAPLARHANSLPSLRDGTCTKYTSESTIAPDRKHLTPRPVMAGNLIRPPISLDRTCNTLHRLVLIVQRRPLLPVFLCRPDVRRIPCALLSLEHAAHSPSYCSRDGGRPRVQRSRACRVPSDSEWRLGRWRWMWRAASTSLARRGAVSLLTSRCYCAILGIDLAIEDNQAREYRGA